MVISAHSVAISKLFWNVLYNVFVNCTKKHENKNKTQQFGSSKVWTYVDL